MPGFEGAPYQRFWPGPLLPPDRVRSDEGHSVNLPADRAAGSSFGRLVESLYFAPRWYNSHFDQLRSSSNLVVINPGIGTFALPAMIRQGQPTIADQSIPLTHSTGAPRGSGASREVKLQLKFPAVPTGSGVHSAGQCVARDRAGRPRLSAGVLT